MSEELRKFIEDLKNNREIPDCDEATVEHLIVTPLLNHLGWSVSSTNGIKFRYVTGKDKVDYALMINSKPLIFIEVKRSRWQFNADEKKQILNYAVYEGVELAILTNGTDWWFYLPNLKGSWDERKFNVIDINQQDLDEIVSKFYDFLEKNNVESGKAIENAKISHEIQKKRKLILETIPKAWNRIINEPHELLIELMKDTVEKLCRYKPDNEDIKLFLNKNKIQTVSMSIPTQSIPSPPKEKIITNDKKITREQLKNSIIEILYNAGGKVESKEVIKELYKKYENIFSQTYYQRKDSSGVIWKHAIHSAVATMRNQRLIKEVKESGRASWELSSEGKKLYEKQYKN